MATIKECRYQWLRVPAPTFVITHSPSRSNRRDGFGFSEERSGGAAPAAGKCILDVGTATEQDLQLDLGLPDLPSRMLERLSYRGPVFLIIDQLDALAGYVDLRTGRLSVLLNLVRALTPAPIGRECLKADVTLPSHHRGAPV
jgi:hypothetical protein